MSPDTVFEVPGHVIVRRIGDETVLLDLESGTYFGLDPVGARMFELIGEGRALGRIREAMLGEFDVTEDRLREDLEKLVGDLQGHGLVVVR